MNPRKKQASSVWLWILLALGFLAGWHWMRTYPIEVREETTCSDCRGSGSGECGRCEGFGTVEKLEECPKCKGEGQTPLKFGHRPRGAPCTRCGGAGQIEKRGECPECKGAGKARCATCHGRGTTAAAAAKDQAVVMGYSPWERVRRYFNLPVERNPCPQRGILGGYEIVRQYVDLRSSPQAAHIVAWGEFEQVGDPWRMEAEVEFQNQTGSTQFRTFEFSVQDRVLATSRMVK